jgi:hypothetical protein
MKHPKGSKSVTSIYVSLAIRRLLDVEEGKYPFSVEGLEVVRVILADAIRYEINFRKEAPASESP